MDATDRRGQKPNQKPKTGPETKDGRHIPPGKEGKGLENDRYSKSDSDRPRVKKPTRNTKADAAHLRM